MSAADDDDFVIPSGAAGSARAEELAARLGEDVALLPVLAYGLPEPSNEEEPALELSELPAAKAAVALGMRAFKPRRLWANVSAPAVIKTELGISLDEDVQERFSSAIEEIRLRVLGAEKVERPQDKRGGGRGKSGSRKKVEARTPYNPDLKSLSAEPGMKLKGRIANLNRFGAFVDVGIPKRDSSRCT